MVTLPNQLLTVHGCIFKTVPNGNIDAIKLNWLPKDIHKSMVKIILTLSLLLQNIYSTSLFLCSYSPLDSI